MKSTSLFPRLRDSAAISPITLAHQVSKLSVAALPAIIIAFVAAATAPSACAQTVTYTGAAVNFGTANVCPSGKTTPAPCSKTLTLTYNVTATGTLGTPKALTTGAPDLDYKLASGTTCTGSVVKGNTCNVNVTFAPIAPGARNGAVEIVDSSGNVLATTFVYGSGTGPMIGFTPPAPRTLGRGFSNPSGVAVDAGGNIFVADADQIKELLAVEGSVPANPVIKNLLNTTTYNPYSLTLDGAGDVFFLDVFNPDILLEIVAANGHSTVRPVGSGFVGLGGVAVDGNGNLFITDTGGIQELLAADGYATVKTLGGGFQFLDPFSLALDGSGNLFVLSASSDPKGDIEELMAVGGYATVRTIRLPSIGLQYPSSLAIDPAGNLFVGVQFPGAIAELFAVDGVLPADPAVRLFDTGVNYSPGLAVDAHGNVISAQTEANNVRDVKEFQFSAPPPLNFDTTYVGQTSSDSPQSIQVQNQGNANLDATALSLSSPNWYMLQGSGIIEDCTAGFSLLPGGQCNISLSFDPAEAGSLTGAVTLVDNSLNGSGATQLVPLSGEGITVPPPQITGISTNYGAPYSVITVTGALFGASQGSSTVTINGVAAPVYRWSNTSILVTVPATATTGNIVVTVGVEASNGIAFTVLPMPVVTGISPTNGPVGTLVSINGKNLLDYGNRATVTFEGRSLQILSQSSTAIQVAIPPDAVTGSFHVLVNDTGINTPAFSVTSPPVFVTGATSTDFGTANVCPPGKTTPAPCSQTLTLTYNVIANSTLAAPRALTTGQPDLDYTFASGGTCTGSVTAGNTCVVNVTFAPIAPGARNGAVEIVDSSGNVLATTYIYGKAVGPLVGFSQPPQINIGSGFTAPMGVAVDARGNVFVADDASGRGAGTIKELLAVDGSVPSNPVIKILNDNHRPNSVAVDGAGNVFFADPGDDQGPTGLVAEILAASGYTTTVVVARGLVYPDGLAVDGGGNVFVCESAPGSAAIEILAAGNHTTIRTLGGGFKFSSPSSLAIDVSGNVFVADQGAPNGQYDGLVYEILAAGDYTTVRTIYTDPRAIAIDPAGNLFGAFAGAADLIEMYAVNGVLPPRPDGIGIGNLLDGPPFAMALDGHGNIFAAANPIVELQLSSPPALAFADTYLGQTSSDSPQSIQVQNQGNANLDGTALSVSANWDLVPGSGTPKDCAASFSILPGALCNLNISFEPTKAGPLTSAVALVDNSLNGPGSTQPVPLSGEGITFPPPQINYRTEYGAPSSMVQIVGVDFGGKQGSSTITFNGIPAPVKHWYDTNILVAVPSNATTGNIVVTVGVEVSNAVSFIVTPAPSISGISPASGPVGTVVTISGKNLLDPNYDIVTFGGRSLQILSQSNSAIQVPVPNGAVTGVFDVFVDNTSLTTPTFTVTQ